MRPSIALSFLSLFLLAFSTPRAPDWEAIKTRGEGLYAQGSFELARRAYLEADPAQLSADDARWLAFRLADTRWRSAAGAPNVDTTEVDAAKKSLEELQRKVEHPEQRDRTWALAEESLGDWSWARRDARDYGTSWPHYQNALSYWAGARDVDAARKRYLSITFRMGWPEGGKGDGGWWYGVVPLQVAQNAVKIAQSEQDKAQALFLLATVVRNQGGDYDARARMFEALRSVVALGKGARFYDDALFRLGEAFEQQGEPKVADDGSWKIEPDYVAALRTYQRLIEEFQKGDSAWWDQAREGARRILKTEVGVSLPSAFLPGSEIGYSLSWRNVESVDLALYPLDLVRDVEIGGGGSRGDRSSWNGWLQGLDVTARTPTAKWTYATDDKGVHAPGSADLHIDLEGGAKLAPGAYLLEARAGKASAREIVLVSATTIVVKAAGQQALVWCCDALTSQPIPNATVRFFDGDSKGNGWDWKSTTKTTGADGTALFDVRNGPSHSMIALVQSDDRQAYTGTDGWYDDQRNGGRWRTFAFTDRSTYKPNDTVSWKVIARQETGGPWTTPKGASLSWEVTDPRGASFAKGTFTLSDFGSASGTLAPNQSSPLGEYRVSFSANGVGIGGATLFRLEEYKLPEYEVHVKPVTDDGKPKLYVVGDKVDVDIEASFYSGGAVANADVEVIVRQNPFWRRWTTPRDYPWYYDDANEGRFNRNGGGQVVKQEKLKTDARGIAHVSFDTPRDLGQDFEYTIEARVTDASRREVSGRGTVRVTRREYDVHLDCAHNLHKPGESVEVDIEAQDANSTPVAASGTVSITREHWVEIWIDPNGREVSGKELDDLRSVATDFPPPPINGRGWVYKSAGYVSEEVVRSAVLTAKDGKGKFAFVPVKSGYYRAHWTSKDGRGRPVEGETWTFVLDESAHDLGYRADGLQIIVDKDTFNAGERAPVMITSALSNRWVLFTVEGAKLHSWQVVHVEGTVKLVMVDVTLAHVPNVWITGTSTIGGEIVRDAQAVIVPPVKQFLDVSVACDKDPVLPGSKAHLHVVTKSFDGEPLSAEVALSLVDESVAAIQADYAGDIRRFFYGDKKPWSVRTVTSIDQRPYRRYKLDEKGHVMLAREVQNARDEEEHGSFARRQLGKNELKDAFAMGGMASKSQARSTFDGPAAPAAEALAMDAVGADKKSKEDDDRSSSGGEVQVRSDFRETALWLPDLVTAKDGTADVEVQFPDSLTRWKASARAADIDARFGQGAATVRANKPLVARLQAPRFFTVGDDTIVSGVIDNRTDTELSVTIDLSIEGPLEREKTDAPTLEIPAQGEVRVDWKVHAAGPGQARVTLRARAPDQDGEPRSDAMVRTYDVQDHGLEVQVARSLKSKGGELVATLDIPGARAHESTQFTIDVAPSLAVTMLDALPYLVQYPYGCTEQTMSRFLPAAIVAHTLRTRGLSPEDAMSRVFGGIEVETAGITHKNEKKYLDRLDEVTRQSLERLYDFQHQDGGFGWWKEGDSDPWMSAYVVWGLSLAKEAGLDVRDAALQNGVNYLSVEIVEAERDPDLAAWMLHALGTSGKARGDERTAKAFAKLWEQKDSLRAYGKALFALAAQGLGKDDEARILCANLANGAQIDAHPDESHIGAAGQPGHADALSTAHWGSDQGWWRWQDGAVESTSFALRALSKIDPQNTLVEQASNWLVQNRRGAQWNNTRDTAIAILALDAFLDATNEVGRDVEYELTVNGELIATKKLTAKDMLSAPARFTIATDKIKDGANEIRLRRLSGEGPLYLAARATFFSREDKIPAHGSGIFVKRQYFKLVPRETLLAGVVYDRIPLEDGGSVTSGERVEVVLTLEAKNDFEYLMFEDMKPAGLEAAELTSGDGTSAREIKSGEVARRFDPNVIAAPDDTDYQRFTGRQEWVHNELREKKVALFLTHLHQGVWETRYELRAEVPGHFSALPTSGFAMYVPEVRCNSDEIKLTVDDRPAKGD